MSNVVKVAVACVAAVAGVLAGFYPPPNIVGAVCLGVIAAAAALGVVSTGVTRPPSAG